MSREEALHKAVCEAVIRLNIGENFQASHILRAALVEYADHHAPPAALAVPAGYVPVSALIEAREEVESWAAYATPYFQDKHDLAEVLAKIDGQIAAAQAQQPAAAVPEVPAFTTGHCDYHKQAGGCPAIDAAREAKP